MRRRWTRTDPAFVHPLDRPFIVPEMELTGMRLRLPHSGPMLERWLTEAGLPVEILVPQGMAVQVESGERLTVRELMARAEQVPGYTSVWIVEWVAHPGGARVSARYTSAERMYPERWAPPARPVFDLSAWVPVPVPEEPLTVTRAESERAMKKLGRGEELDPAERWIVDGTPVRFVD